MKKEKRGLKLKKQKKSPAVNTEEKLGLQPNFSLEKVPDIKIKSLHIQNMKAYDDFFLDFTEDDNIKPFVCFIGDNGTGKSTALNAIQMIFQRYEGYEEHRLLERLSRCIRHASYSNNKTISPNNFLIEADITSSYGDYAIKFDKTGFLDDHPEEIKQILYRLCYYARFDKELHQFQLIRSKWDQFKGLFEAVTGFEINETIDIFASEDPEQEDLLDKYVLGFTVKKPFETISHKDCSNGEKKVIKSFSTLLNLEVQPRIILIDDIAMHVALGRHMALIDSLQSCYPNSQIFSTTHSYRMTKNLKKRSQIYDLRRIHACPIIVSEPWRLRLIDELEDALYKLEGLDSPEAKILYGNGKKIITACYLEINDLCKFQNDVKSFLKEVSDLYVIGMMSCG